MSSSGTVTTRWRQRPARGSPKRWRAPRSLSTWRGATRSRPKRRRGWPTTCCCRSSAPTGSPGREPSRPDPSPTRSFESLRSSRTSVASPRARPSSFSPWPPLTWPVRSPMSRPGRHWTTPSTWPGPRHSPATARASAPPTSRTGSASQATPADLPNPNERKEPMSARPNIVLVHGAWADGSCWSEVIERLQADGYKVTAPQLPETSLADDVARVRHVLTRQDGPTVLGAHSYGGQVITSLGTDVPNVAALVYIAGFGLDEGESIGALLQQGPPT